MKVRKTVAIKAWAAGYFDGDGCVWVQINGGRARSGAMSICGQCLPQLEFLQSVWGGRVHIQSDAAEGVAKRAVYVWKLYGTEARQFSHDILPYSREKKAQLAVFLQYPVGSVGTRFSPAMVAERMRMALELKQLKQETYDDRSYRHGKD